MILFDQDDADKIAGYNWKISKNGYVEARKTYPGYRGSKIYLFHRLIMNCPQDMQVDHINGNKLDNRKCNLRICTNIQNHQNKNKSSLNKSGFKGVSFDKFRGKWKSCIKISGKHKQLGRFDRAIDAAITYDVAANKYFGEYAKPNFFGKTEVL